MTTAAIFLGIAVFWAAMFALFTKGSDRIQLATVCLFLCIVAWGGILWQAHGANLTSERTVYIGATLICLMYIALGALAISFKRWAWWVTISGFSLHLLTGIALLPAALRAGSASLPSIIQWVLLGGVGIWACIHPGSKALITKSQNA